MMKTEELRLACRELAFQNEEKDKRAAELMKANKELIFKNEENKKRAEELTVANTELAFKNAEKDKHATELIVANKALSLQNKANEKLAHELMIANKELAYQNQEKEKRAAELSFANSEFEVVEKQLKEVNKELEAFSYSVSHDLRAPLRAIGGYSAILKEDYESKLDSEANRIIDVIVNNTKMMSELIDNLLTFSKMARLEAVNDFVNMQKLAQASVGEILQIQKQKNRSIKILPLPECKGDAGMLKQVWYNLIDNALKYSSKKATPQIEVGFIDNYTHHIYYVKDNGTGFDMKYVSKLFGVFQRLHRQDEFEGTGLGLALTKRIVTKHGGDIWAESILNEGARFYFSIPKTI